MERASPPGKEHYGNSVGCEERQQLIPLLASDLLVVVRYREYCRHKEGRRKEERKPPRNGLVKLSLKRFIQRTIK